MSLAIVKFGMKDGRTLKCEYGFKYYPATYWEPSDCDVGEATYYIDDEEVEFEKLPKGLDALAVIMYEGDPQGDSRFKYNESEPERDFDFDQDYDG